jgi:hypothetical protein
MRSNRMMTASFLRLLNSAPVINLISTFVAVGEGVGWQSFGVQQRSRQDAVLTGSAHDEAPLAWAQLVLPDFRSPSSADTFLYADLLLYVELRTYSGDAVPPVDLPKWQERFYCALRMAETFVAFLMRELAIRTATSPRAAVNSKAVPDYHAQIGVWLSATHDLTELIETANLRLIAGYPLPDTFAAYAVGDALGESPVAIAQAWLIQMCDEALLASGHEAILASVPDLADAHKSLLGKLPPINRRALLVQVGAGVVVLATGIVIGDEIFGGGQIVKEYVYPPTPSPS